MNTSPLDHFAGLVPGGRFDTWQAEVPAYVVADVDGTLVGASGQASSAVEIAAARAAEAGFAVGFATGRMRGAVADLWDQLRLPGPHILHNGAEVRANGATIAAFPLGAEDARAVQQITAELDLYVEFYTGDGYVVSRRDPRAAPHWALLGVDPHGTVTSPDELPETTIKATIVIFDGEPLDDLVDRLTSAGLKAGVAGSPVTPDVTYVNVNRPDATKGSALEAAVAHLGINLSQVAAIGDAGNDLEMLEAAGTAIAMGNADTEIREQAHLIAPSVDDDGVAAVLRGIIQWRRAVGLDQLGARS